MKFQRIMGIYFTYQKPSQLKRYPPANRAIATKPRVGNNATNKRCNEHVEVETVPDATGIRLAQAKSSRSKATSIGILHVVLKGTGRPVVRETLRSLDNALMS